MTINEAKSSALKKILKVGEDVLVTHRGDSENPRLKSSTAVGAVNSNQEFVNYYLGKEKVTRTKKTKKKDSNYEFSSNYCSCNNGSETCLASS
jgi:hypothetical protein